jgi:hypothetical protein
MPRSHFPWMKLPEVVLRDLCRDLDLGGGDPADTLRSAFGARPTDLFVQQAWASPIRVGGGGVSGPATDRRGDCGNLGSVMVPTEEPGRGEIASSAAATRSPSA